METVASHAVSHKRRSHASRSPDSEENRKRGRPRVEKPDESAADIRMAQRAYRQRKESTLEELRNRVSDLSGTIESMNRTFIDLRDRLASSGVSDAQYRDLQTTSLQYDSLVKAVQNADQESPGAQLSTADKSASPPSAAPDNPAIEPRSMPPWVHQPAVRPPPQPPGTTLEAVVDYSMFVPPAETTAPTTGGGVYFDPAEQSHAIMSSTPPSSAPLPAFQAYPVHMPETVNVVTELKPAMTYSYRETTFARYLNRFCIEKAIHALLHPTARPQAYERIFKLSLMGRDRLKILEGLRMMLKDDSINAPLDLWFAPLIHVGGAGTHYPRCDAYGNLQPKRGSHNLGIVGPQTLALLENAARDNLTTDMTVEIAGFEGEWFDPYDVEGYLAEKGIHIPPGAAFVEAEILVDPFDDASPGETSSSNASTLSAPITPDFPLPYVGLDQPQLGKAGQFDESTLAAWPDLLPPPTSQTGLFSTAPATATTIDLTNVGYSDASTGSWANFLQPGQGLRQMTSQAATAPPAPPAWEMPKTIDYSNIDLSWFAKPIENTQKKSIVIDVAKFVRVLLTGGVCLGRIPGFRRRDVDRALALASINNS